MELNAKYHSQLVTHTHKKNHTVDEMQNAATQQISIINDEFAFI